MIKSYIIDYLLSEGMQIKKKTGWIRIICISRFRIKEWKFSEISVLDSEPTVRRHTIINHTMIPFSRKLQSTKPCNFDIYLCTIFRVGLLIGRYPVFVIIGCFIFLAIMVPGLWKVLLICNNVQAVTRMHSLLTNLSQVSTLIYCLFCKKKKFCRVPGKGVSSKLTPWDSRPDRPTF